MSEQIIGIKFRADGKRVYPAAFKQTVVNECRDGVTAAEVARKYQIPMQNIVKWKSQIKKIRDPEVEKSVPSSAYNDALDEIKKLQSENKKLSKSLSSMTVDRDILKDAVDYATKKKWISREP
jgi:transposase-like protein